MVYHQYTYLKFTQSEAVSGNCDEYCVCETEKQTIAVSVVHSTLERCFCDEQVDTVKLLIVVKSFSGLLAEQTAPNHLFEEHSRSVFGITRFIIQDIHDVKDHVVAD